MANESVCHDMQTGMHMQPYSNLTAPRLEHCGGQHSMQRTSTCHHFLTTVFFPHVFPHFCDA